MIYIWMLVWCIMATAWRIIVVVQKPEADNGWTSFFCFLFGPPLLLAFIVAKAVNKL